MSQIKKMNLQKENTTRQLFRKKLINGELDDKEIEIELSAPKSNLEIMVPPGMEDTIGQLQNIFSSMSNDKKKRRKVTVSKAIKLIEDEEALKLINEEDIKIKAIRVC